MDNCSSLFSKLVFFSSKFKRKLSNSSILFAKPAFSSSADFSCWIMDMISKSLASRAALILFSLSDTDDKSSLTLLDSKKCVSELDCCLLLSASSSSSVSFSAFSLLSKLVTVCSNLIFNASFSCLSLAASSLALPIVSWSWPIFSLCSCNFSSKATSVVCLLSTKDSNWLHLLCNEAIMSVCVALWFCNSATLSVLSCLRSFCISCLFSASCSSLLFSMVDNCSVSVAIWVFLPFNSSNCVFSSSSLLSRVFFSCSAASRRSYIDSTSWSFISRTTFTLSNFSFAITSAFCESSSWSCNPLMVWSPLHFSCSKLADTSLSVTSLSSITTCCCWSFCFTFLSSSSACFKDSCFSTIKASKERSLSDNSVWNANDLLSSSFLLSTQAFNWVEVSSNVLILPSWAKYFPSNSEICWLPEVSNSTSLLVFAINSSSLLFSISDICATRLWSSSIFSANAILVLCISSLWTPNFVFSSSVERSCWSLISSFSSLLAIAIPLCSRLFWSCVIFSFSAVLWSCRSCVLVPRSPFSVSRILSWFLIPSITWSLSLLAVVICCTVSWSSVISALRDLFRSCKSCVLIASSSFSSPTTWICFRMLSSSSFFIVITAVLWFNFCVKQATSVFKDSSSASVVSRADCPLAFNSARLSETALKSLSLLSRTVVLNWRVSTNAAFSFSIPEITSPFDMASFWRLCISEVSCCIFSVAMPLSVFLVWRQASNWMLFSCNDTTWFCRVEHFSLILPFSSSLAFSRLVMSLLWFDSSSSLLFTISDKCSSCTVFSASWSSNLKFVLQSSSSMELNSVFSASEASNWELTASNSSFLLSAAEFACSRRSFSLSSSFLCWSNSSLVRSRTDSCSNLRLLRLSVNSSNFTFLAFSTADICFKSLFNFSFSIPLSLLDSSCNARCFLRVTSSSLAFVNSCLVSTKSPSLLWSNISKFAAFSCENTISFLVAWHCSFISSSFFSVLPLIWSISLNSETISSSLLFMIFLSSSFCSSRKL